LVLFLAGCLFSEREPSPSDATAGWSVERHEALVSARHLASGAVFDLEARGAGGVRLLDFAPAPSPAPSPTRILRYVAGTVGTSEPVLVVHALVLVEDAPHEAPRRITDRPFAYLDPRDERTPLGPQPRWIWTAGAVDIQLPDARDRERIRLP
jgi:hypothetical protein